jgi:hypothetical protein
MIRLNTAVQVQYHSLRATPELPAARPTPTSLTSGDAFRAAAWKPVKLHDASARAALRRLEMTAGRDVSADELTRAITVGTADKDGQFAKKEFKDLSAWALRNAGRLTEGAKKVMALYARAARAAHGKPLSASEYSRLVRQLGAVTEPTTTKPPSEPKKPSVLDQPERWFISQLRSKKYNSREDDGSGNCGPASLTMIARAFRKVDGGAGKMDEAIEHTRRDKMRAGTDEDYGTAVSQLKRGAERYGLKTHLQYGRGANTTRKLDDTIDHLKANLAKGRPVIVHGVMIRSMSDPRASKYGGGHYFVVTKIAKNKHGEWVAHLNDPAWSSGPRTVPLSRLRESIRRRGTYATLAVWDTK